VGQPRASGDQGPGSGGGAGCKATSSLCRSGGRAAAQPARKRTISAFLGGAVPQSSQRLLAHRSPPGRTCPFSLTVPWRPPEASVTSAHRRGRSRRGVAELRSRPPRGRRLAACARHQGPAPPSAAPAPWSLASRPLGRASRASAGHCPSLPGLPLPPRAPSPAVPDPDSLRLGPRAPRPARAARREDERRAAEGGAASAAAGQRGPQGVRVEQGAAERRGLGRQGAEGPAREDGPGSPSPRPIGRARPWEQGAGCQGGRRVVERAEPLLSPAVCSAGSGVVSASEDCARAGCGIPEVRLLCTLRGVALSLLA
jgi:hypothetical protein